MSQADTVVVLDFETTGLSPDMGDRAIEVGAVRLKNGQVVSRFQELMSPGHKVTGFIENYTGITNAMLKVAAPCDEVMDRFGQFIADDNLVAHNASFDKRFLDAEFKRIRHSYAGQFSCSLLMARRVFPLAPNHQLATLVHYSKIPAQGGFHRALYDSEMTAKLWLAMLGSLTERYALGEIPFSLVQKLNKVPKKSVENFLQKHCASAALT